MSLLIKALDKAQNAKTEQTQAENAKTEVAQAQQVKTEVQAQKVKTERASAKPKLTEKTTEYASDMVLSLSPATKPIEQTTIIDEPELVNAFLADAGVVNSGQSLSASPKNAANVFIAKGKEANSSSNKNLAIIAGFALFALLGMAAYFYQFIDNTPETVIPARAIVAQPTPQPALPEAAPIEAVQPTPIAENHISEPTKQSVPSETSAFESKKSELRKSETGKLAEIQAIETRITSQKRATKKSEPLPDLTDDEVPVNADVPVEPENVAEISETDIIQVDAPIITSKKTGKLKIGQSSAVIASKSASINVSKSKAQSGVNPTLMSAYEAYNAGKDSEAQKLYKQVLQRDIRNVDALLGLGAIAQRQGRVADANGWYGKVLEVEPRNNIAQTALIDSQPQGNEQNNETRLKNMLAKQPDDANLHVALGNLYAEQNQWPAAQQAYFDAYRLHSNADNAFNLAVSLDQMGKPKLALPYYQRALSLAQTSANGIDKAALEARIAAIQ
jgi:Tfp pilus assembly protein PilF